MKVIEYVGSLLDGGAETLVKEYALRLSKDGHNVNIVAYRALPETANTKILVSSGVKITYIYNRWNILIKIFNRLFGQQYLQWRTNRIVEEFEADVIHAHLSMLPGLLKINKVKRVSVPKLLYTCHSLPERFFGKGHESNYKACRYLISHNNLQMISISQEMQKELNTRFDIDNTYFLHNGFDFNRFEVKEKKEDIRSSINIPMNAYVLGQVGRFEVFKNQLFTVEVFCEILKKKASAHLLFVGTGPLENEVRKRVCELGIENRVTFLSHRSDVPRLLKAMDSFIFPSAFEGLGIALVEAQVAGIRCVASDTVPKDAFVSSSAIPLSLSLPAREWADTLLNDNILNGNFGCIDNYDLNVEIQELEMLYSNGK